MQSINAREKKYNPWTYNIVCEKHTILIFLACESDHKTTKKTKIFGGKNFDFFGFCNGHFFFRGGGPRQKNFCCRGK